VDENLNVFVVFAEVLKELLLMLEDNFHQEGENLSGAIVNDVEIALNWGVNAIRQEAIELD
jgi:hypothetical protein